MTMKIISLGCGTQSTAVYWASNLGILEKADYAIFADTKREPASVYHTLATLQIWGSIPIVVVSAGDLLDDPDALPFFVEGGGMVYRQCTKNYKVTPIQKKCRELAGLKPYERAVDVVESWIGISTDEARRAKQPKEKWVYHEFPLITKLKWSRQDCIDFLADEDIKVGKSSCVFCPYKSDREWSRMKDRDMEVAIEMDNRVRDLLRPNSGFLHADRKPLTEVDFSDDQIDMFGEDCMGVCGI